MIATRKFLAHNPDAQLVLRPAPGRGWFAAIVVEGDGVNVHSAATAQKALALLDEDLKHEARTAKRKRGGV